MFRRTPHAVLMSMCLLMLPNVVPAVAAEPASAAQSAEQIDRELVVRFTRAYGMVKQAFDEHADHVPAGDERDRLFREPERLEGPLRLEVNRILDLNGVEPDQWRMMLARMETDEELRQRVESLSVPFESSSQPPQRPSRASSMLFQNAS